MKEAFKPGTRVRFKLPASMGGGYGALAEISDFKKSHDWKIPGYLGEGWYHIITIPDGRKMVASEDDLVLEEQVE